MTLTRGAALVVCLLVVAPLSAQDRRWFDLYDEAIKHIQQQEWQEAEAKLLQARQDGPPSGRAVLRYGSLRPPFFPEYYLGIVYLSTGRAQDALQQFQLARKANIDARNAEFRSLVIFEGMAKTAMATAAKQPATPVDPSRGAPAQTAASNPPGTPPAANPTPPAPAPVTPNYARQFADLLATAQGQLGQRNFDAAERTAGTARDLAVKQSLAADLPRADQLLRDINAGRLSARIADALKRRDVAASRRDLNALSAAYPEYNADGVRAGVEQLERELRGADLQRRAMRAFFGGDYAQALSQIAEAEKMGGLTARGHFYRACSLAAQAAATENPTRDRRLTEARRSYTTAASDAQQFKQDLRYISPKIRQLLGIS